jgi:hypothetical protein
MSNRYKKSTTRESMKRDYYFSQKQFKHCSNMPDYWRCYAKLDNGRIELYSEAVEVGHKPTGEWDDYVFLGTGRFCYSDR